MYEKLKSEGRLSKDDLHIDAILAQASLGLELLVHFPLQLGEAPVLRNAKPLPSRELVLGAAQRLKHLRLVHITGTHRQQDLADLHAGDSAVGLTERTTHA